ncbi:HAD family hydrolase [Myxococcota bacterium]
MGTRCRAQWQHLRRPRGWLCACVLGSVVILTRQPRRFRRVGILSNDSLEMARARRTKFGFDELFSPVFISAELGVAKPDRRIFEHVVQKIQLMPAECVFIDNRQDNVDGAAAVGMRGILFENAEQLSSDLVELGLL